jgi:hypothetical protein
MLRAKMKIWNALSWAPLALLAVAASCANGVGATDDDPDALPGVDAGTVSVDAGGVESQTPEPGGKDAGSGSNAKPDAGGSGSEGAGGAEDAGSSGDDASAPSQDAGVDSSGGTGAGSAVPTTCGGADQKAGCCVGNDLYYCDGSTTVSKKSCTSGKVCGWDSSEKYYDCVASPGVDPSGTYPIACQ